MKMIKVVSPMAIGIIFLSGCVSSEGVKSTKAYASIKGNQYENKVAQRGYISFKNPMSLKNILIQLEYIDGKKYFLDRGSENIIFPASSMYARNFADIAKYLAETTGKTIYVDQGNALFKDKLQVVRVKNAKEEKYDFSKIPFKLSMDTPFSSALMKLKNSTDFVFSINIAYDEFGVAKGDKFYDDVLLAYNGTNLSEFFDYLQEKLNVHITVDYDTKIVSINKYKKDFFYIQVSNGAKDVIDLKLKAAATDDLYSELNKSISLAVGNGHKDNKMYFAIDEKTSTVEVYADRQTLKMVENKVNDFNMKYKDMIDIEILNIEIALSKDYLKRVGVDLNLIENRGYVVDDEKMSFTTASALSDAVRQGSVENSTVAYIHKTIGDFGSIIKQDIKSWKLRNHVPRTLKSEESSRVFKNVKIDDSGSGKKVEAETSEVTKEETYNVVAHYNNEYISLAFSGNVGKFGELKTLNIGEYNISNPANKSTKTNNDVIMKNGDVYVLEDNVYIEDGAKYVTDELSSDWVRENRVSGSGKSDMIYVQKLKIVTAKKAENY